MRPVLDVRQLSVVYETSHGPSVALDGIDIAVGSGEIVGLVGETACGKSTLARAILGTLPRQARIARGDVRLDGTDMLAGGAAARRARGRALTFVPQDTYASLNPLFRIGTQIADLMRYTAPEAESDRPKRTRRDHEASALAMLETVQLPNGRAVLLQYPHQLSGGERQRLMLAMALLPRPKIIIADEPTASLDATIQAQILGLFRSIAAEEGVGILFTTHNLAAAWEICDKVVVMHGGRVVEAAPRASFFARPLHPYTQRLFAAASHLNQAPSWTSSHGANPAPSNSACQFSLRCPRAMKACHDIRPMLGLQGLEHEVACHNPSTDGATRAQE